VFDENAGEKKGDTGDGEHMHPAVGNKRQSEHVPMGKEPSNSPMSRHQAREEVVKSGEPEKDLEAPPTTRKNGENAMARSTTELNKESGKEGNNGKTEEKHSVEVSHGPGQTFDDDSGEDGRDKEDGNGEEKTSW
jgi:hypothetical protein